MSYVILLVGRLVTFRRIRMVGTEEHSIITLSRGPGGGRKTQRWENRQHLGRTKCFSILKGNHRHRQPILRLCICPGFRLALWHHCVHSYPRHRKCFWCRFRRLENKVVCFLFIGGCVDTDWLTDCQPGWKVQWFFTALFRQVIWHLFQNWWSNEALNKGLFFFFCTCSAAEDERTERKIWLKERGEWMFF